MDSKLSLSWFDYQWVLLSFVYGWQDNKIRLCFTTFSSVRNWELKLKCISQNKACSLLGNFTPKSAFRVPTPLIRDSSVGVARMCHESVLGGQQICSVGRRWVYSTAGLKSDVWCKSGSQLEGRASSSSWKVLNSSTGWAKKPYLKRRLSLWKTNVVSSSFVVCGCITCQVVVVMQVILKCSAVPRRGEIGI